MGHFYAHTVDTELGTFSFASIRKLSHVVVVRETPEYAQAVGRTPDARDVVWAADEARARVAAARWRAVVMGATRRPCYADVQVYAVGGARVE